MTSDRRFDGSLNGIDEFNLVDYDSPMTFESRIRIEFKFNDVDWSCHSFLVDN